MRPRAPQRVRRQALSHDRLATPAGECSGYEPKDDHGSEEDQHQRDLECPFRGGPTPDTYRCGLDSRLLCRKGVGTDDHYRLVRERGDAEHVVQERQL